MEEEKRMPLRFENPVKIPTSVFDGLETVQESRETNMQDHHAVQHIAARMGYTETALWIQGHQHEYLEGLFRGFAVAEQ